jgi:hypothetical protein
VGDFYRHIDPGLSGAQEDNFVVVARHLILATRAPGWRAERFMPGTEALDLETGEELLPQQVVERAGFVQTDLLGYGPLAGLAPLADETWPQYQLRVFGAAMDSPLEGWLFSSVWWRTDPSAVGAAMRLLYVLDYGVPGDWQYILHGMATSDYLDDGFLWDRVDLLPD